MNRILKNCRVNVHVTDKETNRLLFDGSNLFVDTGRIFIADLLRGVIPAHNPGLYVCDFGDNATAPTAEDTDLISFITGASVAIEGPGPTVLLDNASGLDFQFLFTAISLTTIRELGLFYRDLPSFPLRGAVPATDYGVMLARLKTTLNSIVVGPGRTITIDWKIIF